MSFTAENSKIGADTFKSSAGVIEVKESYSDIYNSVTKNVACKWPENDVIEYEKDDSDPSDAIMMFLNEKALEEIKNCIKQTKMFDQ